MDQLAQITTRYLLGEVSEQEQTELEERYFRDPQVFDQVLQVESVLVDAYAREQLSAEIREQFEKSYLHHPARRNRVEFARALTTRVDEKEETRNRVARTVQSSARVSWWQSLLGRERPKLRFAMAAIAVLIVLCGAWIIVKNLRQQQQPAPTQAKRENEERHQQEQTPQQTPKQEHNAQVSPSTSQPSPRPVTKATHSTVFLALTVGGVRSSGSSPTKTLVIRSETTRARIFLDLKDDNYPHYRASLEKIGGAEIFTQTNISPRRTAAGTRFVFTIPAKQLTSGDYALTLSGLTPAGEVDDLSKSLFRVEQR